MRLKFEFPQLGLNFREIPPHGGQPPRWNLPMLKRSLFVCALMMSVALPARADDLSARMDQMEEQLRQLTGQVEQLTYQLKQLQAQKKLGAAETAPTINEQAAAQQQAPAPAQQAAAAKPLLPQAPALTQQAAAAPALPVKKKPALQPAPATTVASTGQGVETIDESPIQPDQSAAPQAPAAAAAAPAAPAQATAMLAPKPLGLGTTKAAQPNDGGFQGKVLVPAGSDGDANAMQAATTDGAATAQEVALQPETPDDLFLRSEKALLQLQYADAEAGFKDFISKYPDHNLAGSAEFKLGETYWAEQDFTSSAKAYLDSYKKYPKGRRAPDSLLKLGLSLARLGQKDQACATIGSVDTEYPSAVEIKKRAQAEFKREGC